MVYVVTLETPPDVPDDARTAQRDAIKALAEQGTLLLAGPCTDGKGGIAILRAGSIEEARAIYEKTPFAAGGWVKWTMREWDARTGALAGHLSA